MNKVLIIGEAPSRMTEGQEPLCLARRDLARLAGVILPEWNEKFDHVNVLDHWPGPAEGGKGDAWPQALADERKEVIEERMLGYRKVVILGRRAARTFRLHDLRWFDWYSYAILVRKVPEQKAFVRTGDPSILQQTVEYKTLMVAIAPHPSGISHWWNDRSNVAQASRFWQEVAREAGVH